MTHCFMKSYQIEIHPISMTRQPAKSLSVKVTKQEPILLKENATMVITTMIMITKMIIITIMILLLCRYYILILIFMKNPCLKGYF